MPTVARTLDAARSEALACVRCALNVGRTQVVYGVGSADADLLFVGEAPGRDEDLQGEPFVGRAGQLLTSILTELGIARSDIYIANVLKCRPPNNRDPLPDEIDACRPWLAEQIELIDPLLIVTLGNFATKLLLATSVGISKLHGKTYRFGDRWLIPTYHPSAALRGGPNGSTTRDLRTDIAFAVETIARLRSRATDRPTGGAREHASEGQLF